jgi:hypothetical protein
MIDVLRGYVPAPVKARLQEKGQYYLVYIMTNTWTLSSYSSMFRACLQRCWQQYSTLLQLHTLQCSMLHAWYQFLR